MRRLLSILAVIPRRMLEGFYHGLLVCRPPRDTNLTWACRRLLVDLVPVLSKGLKGQIWDKMHGWKEKFLSQARKEVLLKAVIQAIPTYTMSVFQLPKTLCRYINSIMSKFWWGHKENGNKIAWMS